MATYEIAVNLSSSLYPFATEMWGRSIMFPQLDENYNRTVFSTVDPGFEKSVPQVFYMHNVMPTVQGYQAVGYDSLIGAGTTDFEIIFDNTFQLQTADQNNFLFVPAAGKNFVYSAATHTWNSTSPFPAGTISHSTQVTTAFLHGQTYIYFSKIGCYVYDDTGLVLTSIVLAGLDPTQVLGICAANGYMIAVSADAVAWSSIVDPTDFVPSLVTGAGGGSINDAKGPVVFAAQISGGFIIYCQYNAVGATYTGNANFPFILLEVANSGGISSSEQVTYHTNRSSHIVYGSYGLQELNKTSAKGVYVEASDFLASKLFEDFDEITNTFTSSYPVKQLETKIVVIMGRYLVISYGITFLRYTHAIVYDMEFKRYGKLKIAHTDCFEWNSPNSFPIESGTQSKVLPKKSVAFLQEKGEVCLLNFDFSEGNANGVFMIGKFQFRRGNWIAHQYGVIDSVPSFAAQLRYQVWPTKNGKTLLTPSDGFKNTKLSGDKSSYFQKLVAGQNISIMLSGKFNLSTMLFAFTTLGKK